MRRRLMLRNKSGSTPILPTGYKQVEYVESAGTSSVTFPVERGHSCLKITGAFYATNGPSSEQMILTAQEVRLLELGLVGINGRIFVYGNGKSTGFTNPDIYGKNCEFYIVLDEDSNTKRLFDLTFNGVTYSSIENTTESVSLSPINIISIFGSTGGYFFKGRITKPITISTRDNRTILNAVPCYEIQTGKVGFYDTVSNAFKYSTAFSKGADV